MKFCCISLGYSARVLSSTLASPPVHDTLLNCGIYWLTLRYPLPHP